MQAIKFYLLAFFVPARVTVWYLLFWITAIALIAASVVAFKKQMFAKKAWMSLFSLELAALVLANLVSQWHVSMDTVTLAQSASLIIPRVGVFVYAFLTVLSLLVLCLWLKKSRTQRQQ